MTVQYFNQRAREWDSDPEKIKRAQIFAREIERFIQPRKKLSAFEFGCGTGLLSYFLKDAFKTITLADNSDGMIEVLKEKIKQESISNFTPLFVDLLKEEIIPGAYDVIYTLMTLHHVHDIEKIIRIFYRMLLKGGYLCIADLDKEDGTFHTTQHDFEGHFGFDRVELMQLLTKNGFTVEFYKICTEIEKNVDGQVSKYPLFLMIGSK